MMYIKKYNDYFLFEGVSIKQLKEQYNDIPNKHFIELVKCDPYTKFVKNEKTNKINLTNLGKYGITMLKIYSNLKTNQEKDRLINEDLPRAKEYIQILYKYRNAIKINYLDINTMVDIFNIAKKYMLSSDNVDIKILLSNLEKNIDYHFLFNGEKWYIFKPINEKGAAILGAGTSWCTAWGKYSTNPAYKDRENRFKNHNNQGPLFIIINKENNGDKYQFHFQSEQFKNKNDNSINEIEFISINEDIKKYFFPSLFGLEGNDDLQLERIGLLKENDKTELIKKIYNIDDNKLAFAIINKDDDRLIECYDNYENNDSYKEVGGIYKDNVIFFSDLSHDMESLENELSLLRSQKYSSTENVYADVKEMDNKEVFIQDILEDLFKEYYNDNINSNIRNFIGKISFEGFENRFFDKFKEDEKIIQAIKDVIIDDSDEDYENECDKKIYEITKYIDIEYSRNNLYQVKLSNNYLLKYILEKNIKTISNTNDFIDGYISNYSLFFYDSYIYVSYNTDNVNYKNHLIFNPIDDFFDKIFIKINITNQKFTEQEKKDVLDKYNGIVNKYFDNNLAFENESLIISIIYFDSDDLIVNVFLKFKKSNKEYEGFISVDDLANYITHKDLFEKNNLL